MLTSSVAASSSEAGVGHVPEEASYKGDVGLVGRWAAHVEPVWRQPGMRQAVPP